VPDPSVSAIGVVEYSNGAIEKCVLSGTAKTKYLIEGLTPPNNPPEKITFNPGQMLAVLSQVIRLDKDDVEVQVLVVIVAVSASILV
jgi:hypothetical protein